ncbi:MAG: MgtC/SapB family protein [Acholeplasmatales bacterium]|nr:MgtC/SapB family protein [Acholeplasmatales bacterium]
MFQTLVYDVFFHVAQKDPLVELLSNWTGHAFDSLTWYAVLIRMVCAFILGAIIGAERATKSHAAGLRTYILVCMGSCVAMLVNEFLEGNADQSRIGAGVITGIGFIGAGTIIITTRNQVRGLTTAAALWTCACTGLAFGSGFYTLGLISSFFIVIIVMFMPKVEEHLQRNAHMFDMHVELVSRPSLKLLLVELRKHNLQIKSITYDPAYANTGLSVYTLAIYSNEDENRNYLHKEEVLNLIKSLEYVNFVENVEQ